MQAFLSTCCSSYMRQNLPSQHHHQQQQQQSINQSINQSKISSLKEDHISRISSKKKKQHLHKKFGQNYQDMIYYSDDVHAVMRGKSVSKKTRNAN